MNISDIKNFYDNYIDKLSEKNNRHSWVTYSLDRFIPKNCTVLDIGCGTGITSSHLAQNDRTVLGVDLAPKLIEYAQEHNNHQPSLSYICGDISTMEFKERFDAIVMVDVLEHILSESVHNLFNVLTSISHDDTIIYLNIPYFELSKILQDKRSEYRQIVDNPIGIGETLMWFKSIDFIPIYFQLYWRQYVEYLFVKKQRFNESVCKAFNIKE